MMGPSIQTLQPIQPLQFQPAANPVPQAGNQFGVAEPAQMSPPGQAPAAHPSVSRSLQKRFPGLYARVANGLPAAQVIPNIGRAVNTLGKVSVYRPVKDAELSNLDDYGKRAGSLLIATLATLGLRQRIFGVGEFLGFASWFGAMAMTPKIINAVIRMKTGVNLGQQYDSTYGQRLYLFKDPNYLPLQILPNEEIARIADKLEIPSNLPNRRQLTEDKMRQISVQAHTWWMLMAGPATPVISGAVCDLLQNPVTRLINNVRLASALSAFNRTGAKSAHAAKRSQAYLDRLVGEIPESKLSSWWKEFGRDIAWETGLSRVLRVKDVVDAPNQEALAEKICEYLATMEQKGMPTDAALDYLERQKQNLQQLGEQAESFLQENREKLGEEVFARQKSFVETRIENAGSTLRHYEKLLKLVKRGSASPDAFRHEIRIAMQKPVLAEVQRMVDTGFREEAERMVGSPEIFRKILSSLRIRQCGKAFDLMGAAPEAHLATTLKDIMLRKLWHKRVLGYLGGGMLAATALYTALFVGKDFKKPGGRQ